MTSRQHTRCSTAAGCIRQGGKPGHYALMPLGFRVWRNIRGIIFDEMEQAGVLNLQLPIMQPRELWDIGPVAGTSTRRAGRCSPPSGRSLRC